MIAEYLPAFVSFIAGLAGFFTGKYALARRVLQLELRQDDLEERHISTARRAASRARWDSDEQLDMKLGEALNGGEPAAAKKKGWSKWGSSKSSSSEKSSAEE